MRIISKKVLQVVKAASTDQSRYVLNSVKIEETEKGVRAIATNGKMLAMVESDSQFQAEEYPVIEGLAIAPNTATSALIHAESIKKVLKAVPKIKRNRLPILEEIAVKLGTEMSTFAMTDLETSSVVPVKNMDVQFPSVENVIPGEMAFEIYVDPSLLITVLEMASQIAEEGNVVTLGFNSSLQPMKVTAIKQGTSFTGLLMPMKSDRELNDGNNAKLKTLERINRGLRNALKNLKSKGGK